MIVTSAPKERHTLANSDADDAAAEDDRRTSAPVELERLVGGDDAAADLEARQRARVGAGREDDVAAGVRARRSTSTVSGADEPPVALERR